MHGTVLVFFVLTGGLSGTFANFLIPLTDRCKRYGFAISEYAFLLVLLYRQYRNVHLHCLFKPVLCSGGWTAYPPLSALGDASPGSKVGMDLLDHEYGAVRCFITAWWS